MPGAEVDATAPAVVAAVPHLNTDSAAGRFTTRASRRPAPDLNSMVAPTMQLERRERGIHVV